MSRAVVVRAPGGPEALALEEVALADPAPGQARVRHEAIGINFIDTYHRSGLYPLPLPTGIGTKRRASSKRSVTASPMSRSAIASRMPAAAGAYAEARNIAGRSPRRSCPTRSTSETAAAA